MFNQLFESLRTVNEELTKRLNEKKELEQQVKLLSEEVESLEKQIESHVCPSCNHEEEIEALKNQVASTEVEKEEQAKRYEEQLKTLSEEVEELKKLLATN